MDEISIHETTDVKPNEAVKNLMPGMLVVRETATFMVLVGYAVVAVRHYVELVKVICVIGETVERETNPVVKHVMIDG